MDNLPATSSDAAWPEFLRAMANYLLHIAEGQEAVHSQLLQPTDQILMDTEKMYLLCDIENKNGGTELKAIRFLPKIAGAPQSIGMDYFNTQANGYELSCEQGEKFYFYFTMPGTTMIFLQQDKLGEVGAEFEEAALEVMAAYQTMAESIGVIMERCNQVDAAFGMNCVKYVKENPPPTGLMAIFQPPQ